MAEKTIMLMLVVIGVIHLLPLTGVAGGERLSLLYGVDVSESNLSVLMRHRAVLFGLLGGYFVAAAFIADLRVSAYVMAFVSIASFFYLAWSAPELNSQVRRVVVADVVATVALVIAVVLHATGLRASLPPV